MPQAMFMMCWRLSKLSEAGEMTHEQASSVKAWTTTQGREVGARISSTQHIVCRCRHCRSLHMKQPF